MLLASISALSLTLGVLVNDLEEGGNQRAKALQLVNSEVSVMLDPSQSSAPPVWYDCVAQVFESGILERKLKRLARDDALVDIEVGGIVRRTVNDLCADELYEN
ncbi:hypothetical protein [Hirschia baltica]|uniref:Uncharacterized protein n=1 Tax=Hirschia baltica (strain ATCC 49814 / DSM 5838 / IFAM 1418) TaxID=582402 RepID=C6XKU6_HIRBI|nr:hypothetical protein [Hirschia baltica]ACT59663.1 hypothetical protein Hbal_1979 [Hirschia baltica ATCC 49814]